MKQPSLNDLGRIRDNWIRACYRDLDFGVDDLSAVYKEIERYMGFTFERVSYLIHEGRCDYELSRKIHLLTSPHWRTIIKLWRIQNEHNHDRQESI